MSSSSVVNVERGKREGVAMARETIPHIDPSQVPGPAADLADAPDADREYR